MTSRLSQIPGGTQLTTSVLTFSLPGYTCYFQCIIKLLLCLQNADMFGWQAGVFTPIQQSLSLFFEATDSIFGCRYSVTTSCSKIRVQQQESASVFPSDAGACWDPTWQHGAASDSSKSCSAATSSQGLFQQLGLASIHNWFTYTSCLASATSQACSPRDRQSERVLRGQAPAARRYRGIPSRTSGAEAMDASQGSGSKPAYFR